MADKKKVLLNLDPDLYAQMETAADHSMLSITEWVRRAIRAKLNTGTPPPLSLLDAPPFDPTPSYEIGSGHRTAEELDPVRNTDKRTAEWWANRLKELGKMDPAHAYAELVRAVGHANIPKDLFTSVPRLSEWLAEHAK